MRAERDRQILTSTLASEPVSTATGTNGVKVLVVMILIAGGGALWQWQDRVEISLDLNSGAAQAIQAMAMLPSPATRVRFAQQAVAEPVAALATPSSVRLAQAPRQNFASTELEARPETTIASAQPVQTSSAVRAQGPTAQESIQEQAQLAQQPVLISPSRVSVTRTMVTASADNFAGLLTAWRNSEINNRSLRQQIVDMLAANAGSEANSSQALAKALNALKLSTLLPDQLMVVVELNQLLETDFELNRQQQLIKSYEHLRLQSNESGYWSFLLAVTHDQSGQFDQARYYYEQAVRSQDLTSRQRQLSEGRLQQVQATLNSTHDTVNDTVNKNPLSP